MELLIAIMFCLPIVFLVILFIGIIKKNKRLWITSLIFLIVIILVECACFIPVYRTKSSVTNKTISVK